MIDAAIGNAPATERQTGREEKTLWRLVRLPRLDTRHARENPPTVGDLFEWVGLRHLLRRERFMIEFRAVSCAEVPTGTVIGMQPAFVRSGMRAVEVEGE